MRSGAAAPATRHIVHSAPLCAETPLAHQRSLLTSTELFYERNNFPYPKGWRGLRIAAGEATPVHLGLADLAHARQRTLVATLECAGNGRAYLRPPVPGEQWGLGAVSTARWSGVSLAEVLRGTGLPLAAAEVRFDGLDGFARSLPLETALHPDTLLVTGMNGDPLPLEHGGPVRLLVPGWYGMASVKWLGGVKLLKEPFRGHFQVERYVVDGAPLREMAVRAVITRPSPGAEVSGPEIAVSGYAWTGLGGVVAVDLSDDGGHTWRPAELRRPASRYAWTAWRATWKPRHTGRASLLARATDSAGRVQPLKPAWNELGYANNASVPVTVTVR